MLGKAPGAGADTVVLDLEDAVAANKKVEARGLVAKAVSTLSFGKSECLVRINQISNDLGREDLRFFLRQEKLPDGFVIPKLDTVEDLVAADVLLRVAEISRGIASPLPVIGLIESPTAVLNLRAILASTAGRTRLAAVIFGGDDYANSAGAVRTDSSAELAVPRGLIQMTAAAYGVQAIDIVQKNFKDEAALRRECAEAAHLGYTGKQLIHPAQVAAANELFAPDAARVTWARRVVEADAAQQAAGLGAFSLDGMMIDAPTVKLAARILARAKACGL